MLATPEDEMAWTMSFSGLTDVAVDMEQWSACATLCVYCWNIFKNGESVVKTQLIFRKHFSIV
jgi:wyosine [tRNA(Phe)-imidazoG37] synthetase (radical SAM superfamily)